MLVKIYYFNEDWDDEVYECKDMPDVVATAQYDTFAFITHDNKKIEGDVDYKELVCDAVNNTVYYEIHLTDCATVNI